MDVSAMARGARWKVILGVQMALRWVSFAAALAATAALATGAIAQVQPQPAPPEPPIAAPADTPYPGTLKVAVDATDLPHGIFSVHEVVPISGPGPLTLLYPQWLPGAHSPVGSIDKLAGLIVTAGGKRLEWRRDPVQVYAFHIDAPQGVSTVDVDFQFLSAVSTREGRVVMTPQMLSLQWISLALYPAGHFTRDIAVDASVKLPAGFTPATALEPAGPASADNVVRYKTTTFNTLADSPMIAGRYFKAFDLDPGGPARVTLDVIADKPEELDAKADQIAAHRALVAQAYKLFGSHHYDHYDFLFSLSDRMGGNGLEHHQSSEDGTQPKYFTDWAKTPAGRDLLAHEYTHSWNGKFRRPADLWTPNFNVPMRGSLLWVYEGQTQYWGYVLAARSGLLSKQEALDAIAATAATYDVRVGRAWKALEDTTNDPIVASRRPQSWLSWQRSEDYYSEGQLVWLDADTLIRERTGGKKSLDDFAHAFFGVENGSFVTKTYTFDDIVAALNGVTPYDWAGFLHQRLEGHGPGAPLDGVARGGYRLVYTDTATDYFKSGEMQRKITNLTYSIGLVVGRDGVLSEVLWDGPAFKAGLTEGTTLVAVNGEAFDADLLKDAIKAAKTSGAPIELLVKNKNEFRTVSIPYTGGLRYPRFERVAGVPARLDDILAPRK
jgi:predicted metalloprotease with PDZ domain